jgi:diguanylate cyclase (GGDEF)-like protein
METVALSSLTWLVAVQFVLYAAGWSLISLLLGPRRAAVGHWVAFLLCMAAGFVAAAHRDEPRHWLAFNGASWLFVLGYVLLRRGVELFLRQPPRDAEHALTLATVSLSFALVPVDAASAPLRVMLAYGLAAWIMLRLLLTLYTPLHERYGPRQLWLLAAPAVLLTGVYLLRLLHQLLWPDPAVDMDALRLPMMTGYLVGAALFNFSFMTLVMLSLVNRLRLQSQRDALTGLPNRRALDDDLQREWARWLRSGRSFVLLALDLDHFKLVNDGHGHLVGDQVLRQLARRLNGAAREVDTVARTGGEEFLVLMPDTLAEGALPAAERLRQAVCNEAFVTDQVSLPMTVSIGAAEVRTGDPHIDAVLARADSALYRAKHEGRNCCRRAPAPGPESAP